ERGITIEPVRVTSYVENHEALDRLGRLVAERRLTLRVAETFPPERAAEAQKKMAAGGTRGRLGIVFDKEGWDDRGQRTIARNPRDRPGPASGRAPLRASARAAGRGGHQDRAPRRRGDAVSLALGQEAERVLGPVQQRQEEREHGPAQGGGEDRPAQADQGVRRARAELPSRDHRRDGLRLRRAE